MGSFFLRGDHDKDRSDKRRTSWLGCDEIKQISKCSTVFDIQSKDCRVFCSAFWSSWELKNNGSIPPKSRRPRTIDAMVWRQLAGSSLRPSNLHRIVASHRTIAIRQDKHCISILLTMNALRLGASRLAPLAARSATGSFQRQTGACKSYHEVGLGIGKRFDFETRVDFGHGGNCG